MNRSPLHHAFAILVLASLLTACANTPDSRPEPQVPVFDGHVDMMVNFAKPDYSGWNAVDSYDIASRTPGQVDIPRLRRGGVAGGIFTIAVLDGTDREKGLDEASALLRSIIARHSESLVLASGSKDIEEAMARGRVAILPGIEGGEQIGASLPTLRAAHAAGVRAMTLTWMRSNELGDSGSETGKHGGLSPLGAQVVDEMNRLGMLVDLSHAADSTVMDVLARTGAPVIFSHSSTRAICDSPRNVPDEVLKAVAANGGIVMVPFVPYLTRQEHLQWYERGEAEWARLKGLHAGDEPAARAAMAAWEEAHPEPRVRVADVADHVEHVRDVAGIDHVGIGSDFDGMYSQVDGLEDASRYPALFAELSRRGWSEAELRQLGHGNFLRVLRAVEARAGRIAGQSAGYARQAFDMWLAAHNSGEASALSGQSYYDYVQQHVLGPAGMTSTGAEPETRPVADRANAYTETDGKWLRETTRLPWRGTAAGGGYTTARDLVRFAAALEDGKLLSRESLAAATGPQNIKGWYGYGFMVSGEGRDRQYGHEGGAPGMNGILNVRPAQGCTVVGLSNFDPNSMANVVNFVTRRLP